MRKPESLHEFCKRRISELSRSPDSLDARVLGEMSMTEAFKALENEYYECVEDQVPEPAPSVTLH